MYEASDDWVFLATPNPREWDRLTATLPDGAALAVDARFASSKARVANDAALADALANIFITQPGGAWEMLLRAADVACVKCGPAPVEANYIDEGSVGQLQGYVTTTTHPILDEVPRLAALVRFSRSATEARGAGLCGQDTAAVLAEFGYSNSEVTEMAEAGTVMCG